MTLGFEPLLTCSPSEQSGSGSKSLDGAVGRPALPSRGSSNSNHDRGCDQREAMLRQPWPRGLCPDGLTPIGIISRGYLKESRAGIMSYDLTNRLSFHLLHLQT